MHWGRNQHVNGEQRSPRRFHAPGDRGASQTGSLPADTKSTRRDPLHLLSDDFIGEWGFAALVESNGRRILFDTGAKPDTVFENAKKLALDLSGITDVILSHWHDDHTGGLVSLRTMLMKQNPAALSRTHV